MVAITVIYWTIAFAILFGFAFFYVRELLDYVRELEHIICKQNQIISNLKKQIENNEL